MTIVYQQVREQVAQIVDESVPDYTQERLALLVTGIIKGKVRRLRESQWHCTSLGSAERNQQASRGASGG